MAEVTASLVKELRERTGLGMMECKKALVEAEGDIEKAIEETAQIERHEGGEKSRPHRSRWRCCRESGRRWQLRRVARSEQRNRLRGARQQFPRVSSIKCWTRRLRRSKATSLR